MERVKYEQAYSDVGEQQRKVEEAKKQLQRKQSIPEMIAKRQARLSSPEYRETYKRQEEAKREALKEVSEAETSLEDQLKALKKYQNEGYDLYKTDTGYQLIKEVERTVTRKSGGSSSSGDSAKYAELTKKINETSNAISFFKKLLNALTPGSSKYATTEKVIKALEKKKTDYKEQRKKTSKGAKSSVATYKVVEKLKQNIMNNPFYSKHTEIRDALLRKLDQIAPAPSTETQLIASGLTPETYKDIKEYEVPEFSYSLTGLKLKPQKFKYGEQSYEDIIKYYESIPGLVEQSIKESDKDKLLRREESKYIMNKRLSDALSNIQKKITSKGGKDVFGGQISKFEEKASQSASNVMLLRDYNIPSLPSFYTDKSGKDVLNMESGYKEIMSKVIRGQLTQDQAQKEMTKLFNKGLSGAGKTALQSWIGPEYDTKKIFVKPSVSKQISDYESEYNAMIEASKGKTKVSKSGTYGVVYSMVGGTKKQADAAKDWLAEHPQTPEEYATELLKDESAFVNWDTFSKLSPHTRAMTLDIKEGGENLGEIFKPAYDYKKAEQEEWQQAGKNLDVGDVLAGMALSPIVYVTGSVAQGKPMTIEQTAKAHLVGVTQFPTTIYTLASAIPPAIESGKYWKEYHAQLQPQLYEAGFKFREAVDLGKRTGDWKPYIKEMALSPAMTDVVYPLALSAGFSYAAPWISRAAGAVTRVGGGALTKVSTKLPTFTKYASKASRFAKPIGSAGKFFATPYGMTTLFMAPSAVDIGAKTAMYQKGKLNREEWTRSLQEGARTGFQLGMYNVGTYKPTGKTIKELKQWTSSTGAKLKHAIKNPRGYYNVVTPSSEYAYLERVSPFGKSKIIQQSLPKPVGAGSIKSQTTLEQFGAKGFTVKPQETIKFVGGELAQRKAAMKLAGDVKALKGEGLIWTEDLEGAMHLQKTFNFGAPDLSMRPLAVSTRYATVRKWLSDRVQPYFKVPVNKIPKLSSYKNMPREVKYITKMSKIKPTRQASLEDFGLRGYDELQWASNQFTVAGKYKPPLFKATRGYDFPSYYMKDNIATKGIPDVSSTGTSTIFEEPTVDIKPVQKTIDPVAVERAYYSPSPASYYSPWGGRGASKYIGEVIYTKPHDHWKSSAPSMRNTPLSIYQAGISNRIGEDVSAALRRDVGTSNLSKLRTDSGLRHETEMDRRSEIRQDIAQDLFQNIGIKTDMATRTDYRTKQDIAQSLITTPFPYEIFPPVYEPSLPEKPSSKIYLSLPDRDYKMKKSDIYSRRQRGIGYKEKTYGVQSFNIVNKPKFFKLTR